MSNPLKPTRKLLHSYTRTATEECLVHSPQTVEQLIETVAILRKQGECFSIMGGGNSFGDVFLPKRSHVIETTCLSAIGAVNAEDGAITAGCGARSGPMSELLLSHGRYLPSSAGSLTNTLGGDISSDVNGKDSWRVGNFASNVRSLKVLTAQGQVRQIDRTASDLFNAFTGGLGMLGIILESQLETVKAPSSHLTVEREITRSLSDTLRAFSNLRSDDWHFAYAWVDVLGPSASIGRAIVEKARFETDIVPASKLNAFAPKEKILGLSNDQFWAAFRVTQQVLRGTGMDRAVAKAVNSVHYHRTQWNGAIQRGVPLTEYQYPMLKALPNWNKGISPKGMHELQFLFCENRFEQAFIDVLSILEKYRLYPLICAIRKHKATEGLLSFSGEGLSFTVNFDRDCLPDMAHSEKVERDLMACTIRHGGKIYLSKFPYVTPDECAAMYPGLATMRALKSDLDPENLFASATSARLLGS